MSPRDRAMSNRGGQGATVIALAGTGGSGKSTLTNLLCGRYVLPMRVSDSTPVGFVINHDPSAHSATVRAGGEVFQGGDSEVRSHLEHLAEAPDAAEGPGGAGPRTVHLDLPMAVGPTQAFQAHWWRHWWLQAQGYRIDSLSLPPDGRLEIRDLPGYRYSGDKDHLQRILAGLDGAVVVAVFNAEEVDDRKEAEFACEVFRHCRDSRGGSPLVVLNRVDVFRRDRNPEREYQRRLDKLRGTLEAITRKARGASGLAPPIHTLSAPPGPGGGGPPLGRLRPLGARPDPPARAGVPVRPDPPAARGPRPTAAGLPGLVGTSPPGLPDLRLRAVVLHPLPSHPP